MTVSEETGRPLSCGYTLKQLSIVFPVFYKGSDGDTIRLLKQNTVETICLLSKGDVRIR